MFDSEKRDVGKWWMFIMLLLVVSGVILGGIRFLGLYGGTVAERVIFENSYQYSEARKREIATYEATLAELRAQLARPNLTPSTRAQIEVQMSAVTIQLNAAKEISR